MNNDNYRFLKALSANQRNREIKELSQEDEYKEFIRACNINHRDAINEMKQSYFKKTKLLT
jgi:hypothetical protein